MRTPKATWLILLPGRVLFWDGLIHMNQDFWDGITLTLKDFDSNVQRVVKSGPFDVLCPILLHKNVWRPYPMIRLGGQN